MRFQRVKTPDAENKLDFIPRFYVTFSSHPTNWTILTVEWQLFNLNQVFPEKCKNLWPMCRPRSFFQCSTFSWCISIASNCEFQVLQTAVVSLLNGPSGSRCARSVTVWRSWVAKCQSIVCGKSWSTLQFALLFFHIDFVARCLLTRKTLWKRWICMKSC